MNQVAIPEQLNFSLQGPTTLKQPVIAYKILILIIFAGVCQSISIFGIFTNIINIMCFVKQGFKESVNISLMGLAISDLGCLLTMVGINSFITMFVSKADVPFVVMDLFYLVAARPHVTLVRVSSWITAIITLERCLCIIAPLKIRHILTPERLFTIITFVFTILIFSETPIYVVNKIDMRLFPDKNVTLLGLVSTENRKSVEEIAFAINNFFIPISAFLIIIICTVILVVTLKKRTKWQLKFSSASQNDGANKNQRVAKMVLMISTLFICCFIPLAILMLACVVEPGLDIEGKYLDIGLVLFGIGFVLESINSSMNIFIYYHMSSKYRVTFRQIFYSATK